MTKGFTCKASVAAVALTLAALSGTASAAKPGYVTNSQDQVWTTPYGLCWRTTGWAPEVAEPPCDARPRAEVLAPVAAAPAAPAPEPAPAPQAQLAPPAPAPIIEKVDLASDVLFEFDKAELRPEGREKLDELAGRIKDARVESIVAVGHADRIGPEQYNEKLSAARAESVKQYLAQKGIEPDRVRAEGRGENEPVTGDQCKGLRGDKLIACLQPDRRVEVEVRGTREVAATDAPSAGSGATGEPK
jgi:OmpA-OmpF porin, OOP family